MRAELNKLVNGIKDPNYKAVSLVISSSPFIRSPPPPSLLVEREGEMKMKFRHVDEAQANAAVCDIYSRSDA